MRALLVSLIIAVIVSLFGLTVIQTAGENWPGGNASIYKLAGENWPGGN